MILSTHALAGAAIGKSIENPVIIMILSLTVHFIMDGFRHGEYFDSRFATIKDTTWKIMFDLGVCSSILLLYFISFSPEKSTILAMLTGAFFSMLPDLLTVLHWKYPQNKPLEKIKAFHAFSHCYGKFPPFSPERAWTIRNFANDFLFSALAILFIFFF